MGSSIFYNCKSLKSVNISNNIEIIDDNVFSGCSSLTSIIIPDKVKTIGMTVFENCISLKSVYLGPNIENLQGKVFNNCFSLESIVVHENNTKLKSIDNVLYKYDTKNIILYVYPTQKLDTNYTFPVNATIIQNDAFKNNRNLISVTLPNSVVTINQFSFQNCTSLTSIDIPESVTSIYSQAFSDCYSLEAIKIPNKVQEISGSLFLNCYNLQTVELPNSLKQIGSSSFVNCYKLASIDLPNSITNIKYYAFQNAGLISIIIPPNVQLIDSSLFKNCTSLEFVNISNKVTQINDYAFQSCISLESIIIPANVKNIRTGAFANCIYLTSVSYLGKSEISYGNYVFEGCNDSMIIYVYPEYTSNTFCNYQVSKMLGVVPTSEPEETSSEYETTSEPIEIQSSSEETETDDSYITSKVIPSYESESDDSYITSNAISSEETDSSSDKVNDYSFSDEINYISSSKSDDKIHSSSSSKGDDHNEDNLISSEYSAFLSNDLSNTQNGGNLDNPTSNIVLTPVQTELPIVDETNKKPIIYDAIQVDQSTAKEKIESFFDDKNDKKENLVLPIDINGKLNFTNITLQEGHYISVKKDTEIDYTDGLLNIYLDDNSNSVKINVGNNNETKLSIKNFEAKSTTVTIDCNDDVNDFFINSNSDISSPLILRVPNKINTVKFDSIILHDAGTISATKGDNNPLQIKVGKLDVKPKTISNLNNVEISDEITIEQSASLQLEKVTLENAKINLNLKTYIHENFDNSPLLSGTLGKPPVNIKLNKPTDGSEPSFNIDYLLFKGEFENGCESWKNVLNIDDTIFNVRACSEINKNAFLLDSKSLVVRRNEKDNNGKNGNKLGGGPIAGIVIGCIAAVAIIVVVAVLVLKKKKKDNSSEENANNDAEL